MYTARMKLTTVLLVLGFMALMAASRPLEKKGGKLRNKVAGEHKRSAETGHAASASVPRYIQELYNNLTKENGEAIDPIESIANTIRSLQIVEPTPETPCDVFNFSLSGIGNHERAVKSELNLYMVRHQTEQLAGGLDDPLIIVIRKLKKDPGDETTYVTSFEVVPSRASGWITFEVQHKLAHMIKAGDKYAVFKILVYKSVVDYRNTEGHLDCELSPLTFVNSLADEDRAPYLTVQSYDSHVDQIDYNSILHNRNSENTQTVQANDLSTKTKRQLSSGVPVCRVQELSVPTANIPLADTLGEGTVLEPNSYNAGICGGRCGNSLVGGTTLKHSLLVHLVITTKDFKPPVHEGLVTRFQQSCAPVKYSSLVVIFLPANEERALIRRIPDMKVLQCNCMEMMHFSEATR